MARRAKHETDLIAGEYHNDNCDGCKVILSETVPPPSGLSVAMTFLKQIPEEDTRGKCEVDALSNNCEAKKGCTPAVKLTIVNGTGALLDGLTSSAVSSVDSYTLGNGEHRVYTSPEYVGGQGDHPSGTGWLCDFKHIDIKLWNQADPPVLVYHGHVECTACEDEGV